jgi:hypothetical protein
MSQEDSERSRNIIKELEDMMNYADPSKVRVDYEKLKLESKKKLHEVLGFLAR